MNVRVVTLRYNESLGGFPEQPLQQALASGDLLETREYFYNHAGTPHLTFVLIMDRPQTGRVSTNPFPRDREDPADKLPVHLQPLYRSLRQWRNDRAKHDGLPSYLIMRNIQLADICRALPRTLASLRQIEGVGEATVSKYGQDILAVIPAELRNEQPAADDGSETATPKASP